MNTFFRENGALTGVLPSGDGTATIQATDNALDVAIHEPLDAFRRVQSANLNPTIQIESVYGLLSTDVETFNGGTGSVSNTGQSFTAQTSTGVGDFGVIRSRRIVRFRQGQGASFLLSAMFPTAGVADSLQLAGAFTATDGLFVGYNGVSFGFTRRIAGAVGIYRLTLSAGTGGAETATVTLNGTPFIVALAGGLTASQVAEALAESGAFTGWTSSVSPQSIGTTVTFLQNTPAVAAGAFTFSSSGTAAGTFATIQAGAPNDDTTGFVPQTSWNVDKMDGTGAATNPSGVLLDVTKLNYYRIQYGGGPGAVSLAVMLPSGDFQTVHRVLYPNSATIPSQVNPSYRLGWIAASLGSTTALTVRGYNAAGTIEGPQSIARNPYADQITVVTASTTEYAASVLRVRGEFGSTNCQRLVVPVTLALSSETSNRIVRFRVYINPTLTGSVIYQYIDQTLSAVCDASPTTVTVSGGRLIATAVLANAGSASIDLRSLDLRLVAGDVLAVTTQTVSSTSSCTTTFAWQEV